MSQSGLGLRDDTTPRVLVVGAGWDQIPIIKGAVRRGYVVIAADGDPQAPGLPFADVAKIISTRDKDGILELARRFRVNAISYMITESPLPAVQHAAQALNLPSPSLRSVEATVSKYRMREYMAQAGIRSIRFGRAASADEAEDVTRYVGLPAVMKAEDVGGQLGLFRLESVEDARLRFHQAAPHSLGGSVIIEEYVEGPEVNVVAVVVEGNIAEITISDRETHPRAFGVVHRHLYPAKQPETMAHRIRELCQASVGALDVRNGIIFPQIIVGPDGPVLIETGERIPGGVMKELFEHATGLDLVDIQLDVSLGKPIDINRSRTLDAHPAVTVKFLNADPGPLRPGVVHKVIGVDRVLTMPGILAAEHYNDPRWSTEIRPLINGRDRHFFIVAVGDSQEEAVERSDAAADVIDFLDREGNSLRADRTSRGGQP